MIKENFKGKNYYNNSKLLYSNDELAAIEVYETIIKI